MTNVLIESIGTSWQESVDHIFQRLGGPKALLKSSGEVYIKINAVDSQAHTYTSPELVAAVVSLFKTAGASRVEVIENSTHGNYTRAVLEATGLRRAVRAAGGRVRCLDEEKAQRIRLPGGPFALQNPRFPTTVLDLIRRREELTYVNLPKLKTHSMSDVTLGLKNQWGFLIHDDRVADHNFLIHAKIAAISEILAPDLTLIDGSEAVIHGHFPAESLADRCTVPMGILVASKEVVAADMVGASILGFNPESVEHIRLAADSAVHRAGAEGRIKLGEIEIVGTMPEPLGGESRLLDEFPRQVSMFEGAERSCREGCKGNVLGALQNIGLDFDGRGRFNLVLGQGHDAKPLLESGEDTMLCGDCAIAELGPQLIDRTPGKIVVASGCNNLPEIIGGTCSLLGVPFSRLARRDGLRGLCSSARAVLARTNSNLAVMRPALLSEERIREARRNVEQLEPLWESYVAANRVGGG